MGRATEQPERVNHQTLTDCHVLATAGSYADDVLPKGQTNRSRLATDAGKVGRPIGGVWQACTRNEP